MTASFDIRHRTISSGAKIDQDCIVIWGQKRKIGRKKRIVNMEVSLLRFALASGFGSQENG
jgi:hypothetical protein